MSDFELTPSDKRSPFWLSLREHLTEKLQTTGQLNDSSQSVEKTENLRGQIAALKSIIALGDDRIENPTD